MTEETLDGTTTFALRDSSSSDEDLPVYGRVGIYLAANRLKAARENAARREKEQAKATTSGERPCKSINRRKPANPRKPPKKDNLDSPSIELGAKELPIVTVYGFHASKSHFFSFKLSRVEPLNLLKVYIAEELQISATTIKLRFRGNLVSGADSLEQIGAGVTDCLEFEVDELLGNVGRNDFELRFVLQNKPPVVLAVNKTDQFSEIVERLCEICKTASSKLAVFFDGERVHGSDTPSSLDMENGDAIDVIITR